MKSKEDWAKTCILDGALGYFVRKIRGFLQNWLVSAIRIIENFLLFLKFV
jgi:hypothetical protein